MTARVAGHALRWKQDPDSADEARAKGYSTVHGNDAYDPFDPRGPWTVMCECGWAKQVITRQHGRTHHDHHKLQVRSNKVWEDS